MAEGTRSQTAMREIEELLSSNTSAINTAVDGKIAALDVKIAALDAKLEKKLSEMFDGIRLISSSGLFTGERSPPPPIIEERQFPPIFDPGGQRLTTPFQHPDSSRFRFEMEDGQEGRPSTYGSDALPCSNCFHDPISEMKALQQIDSLQDYYGRFESIQSRINLPEELLLGWFISGLRNETRREVRTFRPKTVMQAYAIGRLYEAAHPVNSIGDSSHSVSPQQPLHQTIPPFLQSIDEESNQQEDEGVCVVLTDSCILFEIVESDIAEIGIEQSEKDDEFEAENKVESSRSNVPNTFFTLDAYQLFDEMPETVLELKTISGATLGISIADRLKKYGFISLTFDPGGENHKRLAEFEEQFGEHCKLKSVDMRVEQAESEDENQLEGNSENVQNMATTHYASKLLDEMSRCNLESVFQAKINAGSLGKESSFGEFFVHLSLVPRLPFDPGGQEGIEMDVQAEFDGLDLATLQWGPGGLLLKWELLHSRLYEGGREWSKRLFTEEFHLQLNASHRVRFNALLSWLLLRNWVLLLVYPGSISKCSLSNFLKCGCVTESCYLPWPLEDTCRCFQLKLLPIHWDPGGCFQLMRSATIQVVWRVYRRYQKFFGPARCSVSVVIHRKNPAEFEEGFALGCEWLNYLFKEFGRMSRFNFSYEEVVVINACNVCNELLELEMFGFHPGGQLGTETNEPIMESIVDFIFITLTISDLGIENAEMSYAEMGGLLLGDESVVFTVFDPGGNCVWLNSCYKDDFSFQLKLLPIHWDPGGCLLVVYVLQLMSFALEEAAYESCTSIHNFNLEDKVVGEGSFDIG